MTYLELVNAVLVRMREDTVTTLTGSTDNVVLLVKAFVNDAKRLCEAATTWNCLNAEWDATTSTSSSLVSVTGAGKGVVIEDIYRADGYLLKPQSLAYIRRKLAGNTTPGDPQYYAADGVDANGDVRLRLFPQPETAETLTVYGSRKTPDLSGDDDVLVIPSEPVFQIAFAMSAAERGENGGQSSAELMAVGQQMLRDAVALDGNLSYLDDVWYS